MAIVVYEKPTCTVCRKLAKLLEQRGLGLVVTETARNQIAARGYDPVYGARPVQRVIKQSLQNPLAAELLQGDFPEGTTIEIGYEGDNFTFEKTSRQQPQAAATR